MAPGLGACSKRAICVRVRQPQAQIAHGVGQGGGSLTYIVLDGGALTGSGRSDACPPRFARALNAKPGKADRMRSGRTRFSRLQPVWRRIGAISGDDKEPRSSAGLGRLCRAGQHPGGKGGDRLDLRRQRADDLDARHHHQFADLLHREFDLARCRPFGGEAGRDDDRLGVDLGLDAKALESDPRRRSRWRRCSNRRSSAPPAASP